MNAGGCLAVNLFTAPDMSYSGDIGGDTKVEARESHSPAPVWTLPKSNNFEVS